MLPFHVLKNLISMVNLSKCCISANQQTIIKQSSNAAIHTSTGHMHNKLALSIQFLYVSYSIIPFL